jgi:hypothetical protein
MISSKRLFGIVQEHAVVVSLSYHRFADDLLRFNGEIFAIFFSPVQFHD